MNGFAGSQGEHSAFQDSEMGEDGQEIFVWGTNLTISSICSRVRRFLQHFKPAADDAEAKYITLLRDVSPPVLNSSFLESLLHNSNPVGSKIPATSLCSDHRPSSLGLQCSH